MGVSSWIKARRRFTLPFYRRESGCFVACLRGLVFLVLIACGAIKIYSLIAENRLNFFNAITPVSLVLTGILWLYLLHLGVLTRLKLRVEKDHIYVKGKSLLGKEEGSIPIDSFEGVAVRKDEFSERPRYTIGLCSEPIEVKEELRDEECLEGDVILLDKVPLKYVWDRAKEVCIALGLPLIRFEGAVLEVREVGEFDEALSELIKAKGMEVPFKADWTVPKGLFLSVKDGEEKVRMVTIKKILLGPMFLFILFLGLGILFYRVAAEPEVEREFVIFVILLGTLMVAISLPFLIHAVRKERIVFMPGKIKILSKALFRWKQKHVFDIEDLREIAILKGAGMAIFGGRDKALVGKRLSEQALRYLRSLLLAFVAAQGKERTKA